MPRRAAMGRGNIGRRSILLITVAGMSLAWPGSSRGQVPSADDIIVQLGLQLKTSLIHSPALTTQKVVQNGVSVRIYQRALDKFMQELAMFLGNPISKTGLALVYKSGSDTYLGCTVSYEVGF